jgi:hypothetical protein
MREASIDVDSVESHPYRGNMKRATKTRRSAKAAYKKAVETKHNKVTDAALAGISAGLAQPAVAAPKTNGGAKPNVRFNNFEKRSTYEAVAQIAKTGSQSVKSACEKLRLMGWDKHELDAR